MLDTDLVLQPDAITLLEAAHAEHPGRVLYGAVEWLPPLEHDERSEIPRDCGALLLNRLASR